MRKLELLSPARDANIAIEAIRHGADAVYMGPPSHGARKTAANSLEEIRRVVDYAHLFCAKVYCTVNTIVYDRELKDVERMIRDLWRIGVDALIGQDMGILRMEIPPIELHASTQCDIRTPEKARFLQDVGFSQIVLARELSVSEIREICEAVTIPVETFVHGALCTAFSGTCQAGYAFAGRSGNRGECPQICRLPFTLRDASGHILAKEKYLLSLKDFNAYSHLEKLIDAGVSSFKIEGRLKDMAYVKNVTTAYSSRLNEIIGGKSEELRRSSYGTVDLKFEPNLNKSFNRNYTTYRLSGNVDPSGIASPDTPKSMGERIDDVSTLNPGDGISWINRRGEYEGVLVNKVADGRIVGNKPFVLPKGTEIRRTSDVKWKRLMDSDTAERRLSLDVKLDATGVSAHDETGAFVRIPLNAERIKANRPQDYSGIFAKLGNTPFALSSFANNVPDLFFPASVLTALRRELVETLIKAKTLSYTTGRRRVEKKEVNYPQSSLTTTDNVSNRLARRFYEDHGVKKIVPALETAGREKAKGSVVMTTRHCILREMGMCRKISGEKEKEPLTIENGNLKFEIIPDCKNCEMQLRLL